MAKTKLWEKLFCENRSSDFLKEGDYFKDEHGFEDDSDEEDSTSHLMHKFSKS